MRFLVVCIAFWSCLPSSYLQFHKTWSCFQIPFAHFKTFPHKRTHLLLAVCLGVKNPGSLTWAMFVNDLFTVLKPVNHVFTSALSSASAATSDTNGSSQCLKASSYFWVLQFFKVYFKLCCDFVSGFLTFLRRSWKLIIREACAFPDSRFCDMFIGQEVSMNRAITILVSYIPIRRTLRPFSGCFVMADSLSRISQ